MAQPVSPTPEDAAAKPEELGRPEEIALPDGIERREEDGEDLEGDSFDFFDHLSELRSRLIKSLISLIPAFILAYNLAASIMDFLIAPFRAAMPGGQGLIATGLPDTFLIHLKIGFWGGFFLSSPYWLYQLWAFVAPGLYRRERRAVRRLSAMAALLLFGGAAFAYFTVFPLAFRFFVSFNSDDISLLPTISQYLSLVMTMLTAFGLAFQLPLLLMFLAGLGLVDAAKLRSFRRYAVLLIVVLAAVMTPPDVISQILMAIPMIGLYELSIVFIGRGAGRQF
jgi:sec-independent protein translocase protein TatC